MPPSANAVAVSIPHGTIKSSVRAEDNSEDTGVSIPHGTIKRQVRFEIEGRTLVFQFHMVRLKGLKYERCDC